MASQDPSGNVVIPGVGTNPTVIPNGLNLPSPTVTPPVSVKPGTGPVVNVAGSGAGVGGSTIPNTNTVGSLNTAGAQPLPITLQQVGRIPGASPGTFQLGYYDANGAAVPVAVLPDANGKIQIYANLNAVQQSSIAGLKAKYGSITAAKEALWKKGIYGAAGFKTKASISFGNNEDDAFDKAVAAIVRQNSLNAYDTNGAQVTDVATFVDGRPNYAGVRNSMTTSFTNISTATADVDQFFQTYLGRNATFAEQQTYYSNLHAYEQTHPSKATVATDALGVEKNRVQTSGPSQSDLQALMVASAMPSLEKAGKDPSAISQIGGTLGSYIKQIMERAQQQGVSDIITPTKAFQQAVAAIEPGAKVDNELTKVDNLAKADPRWKALAPSITAGYTVAELAKPVQDKINQLLEINGPADLTNPILIQGLTGGPGGGMMPDNQLIPLIKSQAGWKFTQNARSDAAQTLTSLGEKMGFMA
jgi:hypothetical protein